jgi:hypothetical protein
MVHPRTAQSLVLTVILMVFENRKSTLPVLRNWNWCSSGPDNRCPYDRRRDSRPAMPPKLIGTS